MADSNVGAQLFGWEAHYFAFFIINIDGIEGSLKQR
jgi:hypothetical protein